MIAATTIAGILGLGKADQQRPRGRRLPQDAHGDLGDDAEQPLGAGHDPHQVVAARVEVLAAEPDDLAVDQHDFEPEQVVCRQPVFQAMHAARVLGDIAADRAGDLARRVGRVIEPGAGDRVADAEIGDPGLRHDAAVVVVDLENAVELAHAEQHAVGQWQRAAGQRRTGAARHDFDALVLAIAQHRGDLRDGGRQHDDQRRLAIGGQPVAFIGAAFRLRDDDPLAGHDPPQRRGDVVAPGDHRCIGGRHFHAPILSSRPSGRQPFGGSGKPSGHARRATPSRCASRERGRGSP